MHRIIRFEDHGQDFLTWRVTDDGEIVYCAPFQFDIWKKWRVTNKRGLKVGGYVIIERAGETLKIKYPIQGLEADNTSAQYQMIEAARLKGATATEAE